MAESEQITYHVTDLISEQVSDFSLGSRSANFESEKKPLSLLFLTSEKSLPIPETKI